MAIQIRRGLLANFDPYKMVPGEFACSTDSSTGNQYVWLCFRAGVVKRLGTYEDFEVLIKEAVADIEDEILEKMKKEMQDLKTDAESYIKGKIDREWIPQLEAYVKQAQTYANNASTSANNAKTSETNAKASQTASATSETNAKTYANNAQTSANNAANSASSSASSASASAKSATQSEDFSKLSESWAHGGTGKRTGENQDNSMYWSTISKAYMEEVKDKAEFDWMGEYQAGTRYYKNNLVEYDGACYIALIDNPRNAPNEDHENWDLYAYGYSRSAAGFQEWDVTLLKGLWNGSTYTIQDTKIKETFSVEFIGLIETADQEKAYAKAKIWDLSYEDGRAILTAHGTVPTIDLKGKIRMQK